MAVHAHTTSVNLSAILTDAWRRYRTARAAFYAAGDVGSQRVFLRPFFAKMLRMAWADALAAVRAAAGREVERLAGLLRALIREEQIELARRMDPHQRSVRITSVRGDLALLDYAPWGVRTSHQRAYLTAELSLLEAAA